MTKIPAQGHESVITSWKAEETVRFLAAMVHSVIQAIDRRHGCRVDLAQTHQIEDTNRRIDRTSRTRERAPKIGVSVPFLYSFGFASGHVSL